MTTSSRAPRPISRSSPPFMPRPSPRATPSPRTRLPRSTPPIESYRTYGKSIGFATLNKFLSAYFGTGNSEKTIRANMAEELIASRYADDVYASFTYTDDEIDAYYAENADSYDRVNVLYTLISAAANEDEGIDADTAKAAAEDKAKVILAGAAARRKTSAPPFSRRPRPKPPKRATPSPPSSAALRAV